MKEHTKEELAAMTTDQLLEAFNLAAFHFAANACEANKYELQNVEDEVRQRLDRGAAK